MIYQRVLNRGIRLGSLFERAHAVNPAALVHLDHDLDLAPQLGRTLTLRVTQDLVEDFAHRLHAHGLRHGDHLVIHKRSGFDITLLACAAARMGIVPVLLSPYLEPGVVRILVRRLGRPYLFSDATTLSHEAFDTVRDDVSGLLLVDADRPEESFAALEGAPAVPAPTIDPDHPTLITHTSGTTGVPKLAVHTGRSMQARYRPQALVARAVRRRETFAIHVSFVHSRIFTAMPIAVLQGHSVLMMRDDDAEGVAELFARVRPGLVEAHPNTFVAWEQLEHHRDRPLRDVKIFSSTFDAIHPRTVETMLRASGRSRAAYVQMYGQSEVGPIAGRVYTRRRGMPHGRCVGRPFPLSTDVRVVPRDGKEPTRDHPGYIEVRSDGRIVTYFGEHERWEQQVNGVWWRMGDVGYRGRLGCLHMQDREVDLVDGLPSTLEVEDHLLAALPQVQEVVIVRSVTDGAPVPVLCVREGSEVGDEEWAEAIRTMPPLGARIQLSLDEMPTTSTTKVRRLELARLLADRDTAVPAEVRSA